MCKRAITRKKTFNHIFFRSNLLPTVLLQIVDNYLQTVKFWANFARICIKILGIQTANKTCFKVQVFESQIFVYSVMTETILHKTYFKKMMMDLMEIRYSTVCENVLYRSAALTLSSTRRPGFCSPRKKARPSSTLSSDQCLAFTWFFPARHVWSNRQTSSWRSHDSFLQDIYGHTSAWCSFFRPLNSS